MRPQTHKIALKALPATADCVAFGVSSLMAGLALGVLAQAVDFAAFRDAMAFAFLLGALLIPRERPELAVRGFDSAAFVRLAGKVAAVGGLTFLLTVLTGEGARVFPASFWGVWVIAGTGCLVVARALARSIAAALYRRKLVQENVVIVCAGVQGLRLAEWLRRAAPHIRILGFFEDRGERVDTTRLPAACLGRIADAVDYCRNHSVDRIFLALPGMAEARIAEIVGTLSVLPVKVTMSPDLAFLSRLSSERGADGTALPVFDLQGQPLEGWRAVVKRLEDVSVATIALIGLSPLFVLLPLLIKLDSPGPVLVREKRYGFGYKPFDFLKFRTTYADRSGRQAEGLVVEEGRVEEGGAIAPAPTRMGAFLRRTGLDDLPQFFNVLKGDMSVVGPRPHFAQAKAGGRTYEDIIDSFARRYRVKPGITGWAQIHGAHGPVQAEEDLKRRFALDLYYIQNWSLWLDGAIVLRALAHIFMGRPS